MAELTAAVKAPLPLPAGPSLVAVLPTHAHVGALKAWRKEIDDEARSSHYKSSLGQKGARHWIDPEKGSPPQGGTAYPRSLIPRGPSRVAPNPNPHW